MVANMNKCVSCGSDLVRTIGGALVCDNCEFCYEIGVKRVEDK
jgi:hypothetical protein